MKEVSNEHMIPVKAQHQMCSKLACRSIIAEHKAHSATARLYPGVITSVA